LPKESIVLQDTTRISALKLFQKFILPA